MTHLAADLLAASLDPAHGAVTRVETHVSTVVFQGPWAYKVKRPVRYEFVDQSTPELRREACHRELALNERFAPGVYVDVVDITDATGAVVDHALRMRRLPDERRLSVLLHTDPERAGEAIRAVAKAMATAHAQSRRGVDIDAAATADALQTLWLRSLADMQTFVPSVLDQATFASIAVRARMFLDGRDKLFEQRISERMIVDGHGDLLADDIFVLDDGVPILDCLDFDDRLRFGDVLADIAFLAMDLERLGHAGAAADLQRWYDEYAGVVHPASLRHHYIAYRAIVRSKVACLRAEAAGALPPYGLDGGGVSAVDPNVLEARQLLAMAARHLQRGGVHLVVVGGLPGSGKSTLADNVGRAMGWAVIRSDQVRKELSGPTGPVAYGTGAYGRDQTDRTYAELFVRAATALQLGQSVIIDASFMAESHRKDAAAVARVTKSEFLPLRCEAPFDELVRRIEHRRADPYEPSDATPEIAAEIARRADPWPSAFTIETSHSVEESCQAALDILSTV